MSFASLHNVLAERREYEANHFEVPETKRDTNDREAKQDPRDQVSKCQPDSSEEEPDDVAHPPAH